MERLELAEDQLDEEVQLVLARVDADRGSDDWIRVEGGEYLRLASPAAGLLQRREEQRRVAARIRKMIAVGAVGTALLLTLLLRNAMVLYVWGGVLAAIAALYTEPLVQRLRGDRLPASARAGVLLLGDRMIVRRDGRCSVIPRADIAAIMDAGSDHAEESQSHEDEQTAALDLRESKAKILLAYRDDAGVEGEERVVLEESDVGDEGSRASMQVRLAYLQSWLRRDQDDVRD